MNVVQVVASNMYTFWYLMAMSMKHSGSDNNDMAISYNLLLLFVVNTLEF